ARETGAASAPPTPRLSCRFPRVDRQHLARDVAGERTAEERGGGGDVVGGGHALERRALEHRLAHRLGRDAALLGLALDDAIDAVALDGAGSHAVDRDV